MKPMTLVEYHAYHPDDRKYELQEGWLLSQPFPGFQHGLTCSRVCFRLDSFVRPRDLGYVLTGRVEYLLAHNPPTVLLPDVSFVSAERALPHLESDDPFPGPPDLAIEVLMPEDDLVEIHGKVADYLAAGCPLVWIVDPAQRSVAVHRELLFPSLRNEGDVLDGGAVIPGFSVPVRELFVP